MKKILVISDLHINSTVALCKPTVLLDEGQQVSISKGQRLLWDNWLDFLDKVKEAKPDILIVNGDAVEGDDKNRSFQIITRNPEKAVGYAVDVLEPLVNMIPNVYFVRGTAAHSGKSSNLEESLAKDLGGIKNEETGSHSHWSLFLEIEGLRISVAHHTTMGGLPWTRKNAALQLAAKILFDYANGKEQPPDIALRAHVHRWADSYDAYPVRALVTPCWSLATEYIHRIAPEALAEIGGAMITCDNGKYKIDKISYIPKGHTWQKI